MVDVPYIWIRTWIAFSEGCGALVKSSVSSLFSWRKRIWVEIK